MRDVATFEDADTLDLSSVLPRQLWTGRAEVAPADTDHTLPDLPLAPARVTGAARLWLPLVVAAVLVLMVAAASLVKLPAHPRDAAAAAAPPPPPSTAPAAAMPAAPVTYEAEAAQNTLSGSAFVGTLPGASGGQVVKNIGDWNTAAGPGELRFTGVIVPSAGRYALTFYYVHPNGDRTRSVTIAVQGGDTTTVTVATGAACCAHRTLTVQLQAGANVITFGNPRGHAPALDRIEIAPAP